MKKLNENSPEPVNANARQQNDACNAKTLGLAELLCLIEMAAILIILFNCTWCAGAKPKKVERRQAKTIQPVITTKTKPSQY